ncbi:MAG: hypothetical protein Q4D98_11065 [Planctomycetia bacterium]|nr:hypothetical protein [Planctomycetia bacterium]
MNIRQFLEHYGISENPFADEEASTDPIFKGYGIDHAFHPAWDKIFGKPEEPATSVVFGEKGSGKTAMRLQMVRRLAAYNSEHPDGRVFVIPYDDFNPFIDRFREKSWRKNPDRMFQSWQVRDHIDAILSLGTTQLVDRVLKVEQSRHPAVLGVEDLSVKKLSAPQSRDLMLLAMLYDQSSDENRPDRWKKLARLLRFRTFSTGFPLAFGILVTLLLPLVLTMGLKFSAGSVLTSLWFWLALAAGWGWWVVRFVYCVWKAGILRKSMRPLEHNRQMLRQILARFPAKKLADQPLPLGDSSDARYSLLSKFQSILATLGFPGVLVLVDRVDEPYQINGVPERMKEFIWPILDNKLLKHSGMGFKLLLPGELNGFVLRENEEFRQRARLDKQNLVASFQWTGQSLYDLANTRIAGCVPPGNPVTPLEDFFDADVGRDFLVNSFQSVGVPRRLFKLMYQVIVNHANLYTENDPVWTISRSTFLSTLADIQKNT